MIVTHIGDVKRKLTPQEKEMLEALKDRPIEFDEDNPESTEEQLKQFKRVSAAGGKNSRDKRQESGL